MTLGHSSSSSSSSPSFSCSSSSPLAREERVTKTRKFRSTKKASKARRDLINEEIRKLCALLPISSEERERLSYLHAMSVICTYIRKSLLLSGDGVCVGGADGVSPAYEDLLNALPGFLVVMTCEGKLLYVSENVSDYLGFSMVEVLQGDTFYSMITNNDAEKVKFYLQDKNLNTGRSCVFAFRTHRQCCPLLVKLRMFDPEQQLVVALCSPSLTEKDSFTTTHALDMRYTHTDSSVVLHLGYEAEELIGRSWYSFIHPDDLLLSAKGHKQLLHREQVHLVLRVQDKHLKWVWLYTIATRHTESHTITCTNYIISEFVAEDLRDKLSIASSISPARPVSHPIYPNSRHFTKRPAEGGAEIERRKRRRMPTPVSSFPYTPTSSSSSPVQLGNIDFPFSSSPLCPFYPSPAQNFQSTIDSAPLTSAPFCFPSEVSVPDVFSEAPAILSDGFLYVEDFNSFSSSAIQTGRTTYAPEDYGWSGLPTPPPAALHYSEMEQAEISVLAQQISSLASCFSSYCTKSSVLQSDYTPGSQLCDSQAFLLDEEVIDSVMQVPRAMLEVQDLEALLDLEKFSEEQHKFNLYSHMQQDEFNDESLY